MSDYRLIRRAQPPAGVPVLDAAQRQVVAHPGGPLLVLAGPGTGKTTTLVEAVVARHASGVPVEQVLMLTFSRRAAAELRDRVTARLDSTVREPIARTLHSYAFGVLRMAAVRDKRPAPRLLGAAEQDIVIRELLDTGDPARWPAALQPALGTLGFADELRDLLMRAVERGLDGLSLQALGRSRGRADWVAAGRFLLEYDGVTVLRDPGGHDPAELVQGALNALRDDPGLLALERERRRRIFVDEYQDTDPAQAELLALLARGADELVLVGDPDQSIYAFRGADESAIRQVDERFGSGRVVPVVALHTSRRSGPTLVAATRRLASRLPGRADHRSLTTVAATPAGRLEVAVFRTASEEAAHLAAVLRAAYLDGTAWSRMAVLVRSTTQTLGTLRRAMITAGVPVAVRGADIPLAEQPAVRMLLDVLTGVLHPTELDEQRAEAMVLGPLGGADTLYLRRLRRELHRSMPTGEATVAAAVGDLLGAGLLPQHLRRPVERVAQVLDAGTRALAAGGSTEDIVWAIWDTSGLAERWERASRSSGGAAAAADRDLDAVVQLFDEVARFTDRLPGVAPAAFVEYLRAQQIPGDISGANTVEREAVAVLTAHAAKGLEWDLVCIAHVQEGVWPDLRRRGTLLGIEALVDAARGLDEVGRVSAAPQLAEERRLFYVAATRARDRLIVTAVAGDEEQPSRFLDEVDPIDGERPLVRMRRNVHLPGLVAHLRAASCSSDALAGDTERLAAASELARLAGAGVNGADPDQWWGLAPPSTDEALADPGRPVPVSPSRVESFLNCELRQVMRDLGVQDAQVAAANLGSLVHALAAAAADECSLAEFEDEMAQLWGSLDFGAQWFADNERARASVMLGRLVDWLHQSRVRLERVAVERSFAVTIGDALVSGRVDRLERDTAGRLVVVDFKTGKSKLALAQMQHNPQLGTYQLAVAEGAFPDEGREPGGALLVQLGTGGELEQWQPPPSETDDPDVARMAVAYVAQRMRGSQFSAAVNPRCQRCEVRSCCPLQIEGRQVTQ